MHWRFLARGALKKLLPVLHYFKKMYYENTVQNFELQLCKNVLLKRVILTETLLLDDTRMEQSEPVISCENMKRNEEAKQTSWTIYSLRGSTHYSLTSGQTSGQQTSELKDDIKSNIYLTHL